MVLRDTGPTGISINFNYFTYRLMVMMQASRQLIRGHTMHNMQVKNMEALFMRQDLRLTLLPLKPILMVQSSINSATLFRYL